MILTKDIRLQLDSQNDLYGNNTYKYHINGGIRTKRKFDTKNSSHQNILKTKTKYNLTKTSSLRKYSFLTQEECDTLRINEYLNTNKFHIITPDTKYQMKVVLKQVITRDKRSPDQKYLNFNVSKFEPQEKYYILNASECPTQNLTETYINEYGEPCFQLFDYKVINPKNIRSEFVVCYFSGNNTFEVSGALRNFDSAGQADQEEQPLVLFDNQVKEILAD